MQQLRLGDDERPRAAEPADVDAVDHLGLVAWKKLRVDVPNEQPDQALQHQRHADRGDQQRHRLRAPRRRSGA